MCQVVELKSGTKDGQKDYVIVFSVLTKPRLQSTPECAPYCVTSDIMQFSNFT